ncbi:MAG: hypothetical protein HUK21_09090 [Fibrobacteraceae bacterium]|nr:hypothetical protein [Fibrobacteraceae bacterium]
MKKLLVLFSLLATTLFAMDENGWASTYESIAAFDSKIPVYGNRPGYVKPIINNLGNVLNSNWYVSSSVPAHPSFEVGLPVALIPIGSDDQTFKENGLEVPTIFGTHAQRGPDGAPIYDGIIYGNETLNGLGVFTYPYLQIGVGFYHARAILRGMYLPSVSNLKGFSLMGFGLQYSFGHFFQYMLPAAAQPLDVSLVFGYNSSSIGYQPDKYEGQLDLDVSALTFDVVIGYRPISLVEVMLTLGYQSAEMKSSGHLVSHDEGFNGREINPDISVKGNNGFKFGLEVAFQLGSSFHPVVGYDYAGKSSFTTNILYVKYQFGTDKTPDEIAKEKGYNRNASKEELKEEIEENATQDDVVKDETEENMPEETVTEETVSESAAGETAPEDSVENEQPLDEP